jgi:hypothetical protein
MQQRTTVWIEYQTYSPCFTIRGKGRFVHNRIFLILRASYGSPSSSLPPLRLANVGTAYINCCGMVEPNMPWSGRKGSGLGQILSGMGRGLRMQSIIPNAPTKMTHHGSNHSFSLKAYRIEIYQRRFTVSVSNKVWKSMFLDHILLIHIVLFHLISDI